MASEQLSNTEKSVHTTFIQLWSSTSDAVKIAIIIAIAAVLSAPFLGGFYTSHAAGYGVYVTNRFTGNVSYCMPRSCQEVR